MDYIPETDKGKQFKADSRVGTGVFLGYVWRSTEYLIGTPEGIFRCRTVRRRAEEIAYNASCFDFLDTNYDEYIMKGAKTRLHISEPVGMANEEIPTRGRDFAPRRIYIKPSDYDRHGHTQGCRACTWMQNRVGPRPGHTEACRSRMEGEIAKLDDDDRLKKV